MSQYGPSIQTLTFGNPRTYYDVYSTTPGPYPPYNQKAPLGAVYFDNTPSTTYSWGIPAKYRYVRYNSTANAAVVAYPAPVFWTDEGHTTVSSTMSEGVTGTQQDIAGWMMINSGDLTSLTATILNGNFVFICTAGLVLGGASAAAVAAGDWLIGGGTAWTPVRVASGTATGYKQAAIALTAVSSSKSDLFVCVESL